MINIHPTAHVDSNAQIGEDVEIGPFTIVHPNVVIGARTKIGSHSEIGVATALGDGSPLRIGSDSLVRSHSVFYESSTFGSRLVTGHRVTVREQTIAGENLQIGTLGDIQGDCRIGNYVRFHSNVHIGKQSTIGHFVWIFPYVVLTNDPTPPSDTLRGCSIEDYAAIATMSVVLPGVTVGTHALVAAHACVSKNVPPYMVAAGVPAKILCETVKIMQSDGTTAAYPWNKHFHRGYPDDIVDRWKNGDLRFAWQA
jgi:acyl-[acyl carrier protein]--UDP-N-acetylglucosamine O-acyltransferase